MAGAWIQSRRAHEINPRRYSAAVDADVERFSNLQTGQSATVDAPLAMALVAEAAAVTTPHARHVLDAGCGAGNYTLKVLDTCPAST